MVNEKTGPACAGKARDDCICDSGCECARVQTAAAANKVSWDGRPHEAGAGCCKEVDCAERDNCCHSLGVNDNDSDGGKRKFERGTCDGAAK